MNFKGLVTAAAAVALSATPVLAASSNSLALAKLAPATTSVSGSELEDGGNVVVIVLATIAAGLGLWAVLDGGNNNQPVSP